MTNKHLSNADVEYFSQFADGYAPYSQEDLDLMVDRLLDTIEDVGKLRICEVGSASGQFSAELARRPELDDMQLYGLDIARPVLALYPFHRICGSAFEMPVADGVFDLVCYVASLHHLAPFSDAVAEMSRVLAPGGHIYCVEPNLFHPHRCCFMRFQRLYRLRCNANDTPINPAKLEALLDAYGMRLLRLHYVNIAFRNTGFLQRIQNFISSVERPSFLDRVVSPWFIMVAVKDKQ